MDIVLVLGAAFLCGAAISFFGYCVGKYFLKHRPRQYPTASIVRQTVSILFLTALYFVGQKTAWDVRYLLIGGALGITLPSFYFTARLLKLTAEKKSDQEDGNG